MNPIKQHQLRIEKELSVVAEILMDIVVKNPVNLTTLKLMDLGIDFKIGSPATLHAAIKLLRKKGYFLSKRDQRDGRVF